MLSAHTNIIFICNLNFILGGIWAEGLYSYPGSSLHHCSWLLEDDLGIWSPGKVQIGAFCYVFLQLCYKVPVYLCYWLDNGYVLLVFQGHELCPMLTAFFTSLYQKQHDGWVLSHDSLPWESFGAERSLAPMLWTVPKFCLAEKHQSKRAIWWPKIIFLTTDKYPWPLFNYPI